MRVLGPQNLRQVLPFACHWHCGLDHPSLALEGWSVGIVVLAWTLDPDVLSPTDSCRRGGLVRPTRVTSGAGVLPVSAGRQSGADIVCLLNLPVSQDVGSRLRARWQLIFARDM